MNRKNKPAQKYGSHVVSTKQKTAVKPSTNEAYFRPSKLMTLIPADELVSLSVAPRKRHWGSYIQSNQTGMLFGERGRGKTWFAMATALSMSACVEFLGNKPKHARRVIYLDGEMDLRTFQARMRQICESLSIEPPTNLKVFTPESFSDLLPCVNTPQGQNAIDEMIGIDWDVLFIDNYSAWSSDGRETAEAWAPFMRWMLGHKRAGRAIIVVHHSGKAGKQRGSSKHEDALDWSINLLADKQSPHDGALRFSLVWEKARHLASDQITPIAVTMHKREDGVLTWKHQQGAHKDPKIAKALELHEQGMSNTDVANKLSVDRTTVGRWLKLV